MKKTALITGASRGIGAAIAQAFAAAGYDLYITCIHSEEKLNTLADRLSQQYHIRCTPFVGDMGDFSTVERLFSRIGELDAVINNAGISHIGLLSDMSPEEWRKVMATNLDSCFYTCKLAIPLMLRKKSGRIINISVSFDEIIFYDARGDLAVPSGRQHFVYRFFALFQHADL